MNTLWECPEYIFKILRENSYSQNWEIEVVYLYRDFAYKGLKLTMSLETSRPLETHEVVALKLKGIV